MTRLALVPRTTPAGKPGSHGAPPELATRRRTRRPRLALVPPDPALRARIEALSALCEALQIRGKQPPGRPMIWWRLQKAAWYYLQNLGLSRKSGGSLAKEILQAMRTDQDRADTPARLMALFQPELAVDLNTRYVSCIRADCNQETLKCNALPWTSGTLA